MQVNVKKLHPDAKMPTYAHPGDAGMDLFTIEAVTVPSGKSAKVRTGLAFELPEGHVGLCWDKSGLSINHSIKSLGGVLDEGYRGELILGVFNFGTEDYVFEKHDKVMQMLIQKVDRAELVEVDEMSNDTSRGVGGLGSTGK
jgi:dUTP pyrophosphatase